MKNNKLALNIISFSLFNLFYCQNVYSDNISSLYSHSLPDLEPSLFKQLIKDEQPSGAYQTTLFINKKKIHNKNISYENKDGKLIPKFTIEDLINLNIDVSFYNLDDRSTKMFLLDDLGISFNFNFTTRTLYLAIPQKAFIKKDNRIVDKSQWDDGINAFFSRYDYFSIYKKNRNDEHRISFNSGINIDALRIRSHSAYQHNSVNNEFKLYTLYAYQQLDLLSSLIYTGQFTPTNRLLSSEKILGLQLISNNLLSSHSLYANKPIIEGIADTQALVTVKQQDNVIYETTVPPGPFVLNELPAFGNSQLTMEIKEADGRIKKSTHYFTTMPNQLNARRYQYNIVTGQSLLSNHVSNEKPFYLLGEFAYGLNQQITAYSAFKKKEQKKIFLGGFIFGFNQWGGIATDISYFDKKNSLFKYQLRYNKYFNPTKTSLSISTSYYFSKKNNSSHSINSLNKKYYFSISQSLKNIGSFSLGYHHFNYTKARDDFNLNLTFSSSFKKVNYSIKYYFDKKLEDNKLSFYLGFPLFDNQRNHQWVNNNFEYSHKNNHYTNNTHIGGSILNNSQLNYAIGYQHSASPDKKTDNYSANLRYQGNYQSYYISGKHTKNSQYDSLHLGISGAFVLHKGGITLSQHLGKTFALVDTAGFSNIKVNRSSLNKTDTFGYLVLPNLSPYKRNNIVLDSNTLPNNVISPYYTKFITPTLGAIPYIQFPIKINKKVLFKSISDIPIAATATVFDDKDNQITRSSTFDNNRMFFSGIPNSGKVKVEWGNENQQQCQFEYDISEEKNDSEIIKRTVLCQKPLIQD